jgi:uncharacterized membrane protein YfcA
MEYIGYLFSVIIGISLGLIGGGGSIFTIPVLVYLLHIEPVVATAYSLFIVGVSSVVGVIPKYKQNLVSLKTALIFGLPAIAAVFVTRAYIVPIIPETIFVVQDWVLTKNLLLMLIFAVMMLFASVAMIRDKPCLNCDEHSVQVFNYPLIFVEGTVVGLLTGLVGAGGGFLIIPALVILSKLPIKKAIGTSLLIIAAKSLIGFTGDMLNIDIDWKLLLSVTALAILGILMGDRLSKKINGERLKIFFGWLILLMGIYILAKETVLN